jgi:hypothetical protein
MKVMLRDTDTDLFFLGPNMWTNDPEKAVDFGKTDLAVKTAKQASLEHVELVLCVPGVREALSSLSIDSLQK